ncbi:MAG: M23 family metallopeptidase [Acidobacteria bacterium]|nr:M23 family metallopeptidase [Acidobacteriota bacterium]
MFGTRRSNRLGYHTGLDIAGDVGDEIYAVMSGTISDISGNAKDKTGYGLIITVTHADGSKTRYAHLSGVHVSVGASVGEGELIGFLGTSGNASDDLRKNEEHVHLEYLPPGCKGASCATDAAKFLNSPCSTVPDPGMPSTVGN